MKKTIVFVLLFSTLFAFPAAAEEIEYSKFYDAEEACYEGYCSELYACLDKQTDLDANDSRVMADIIDWMCSNFDSGIEPEQQDPDFMREAYECGCNWGYRDYYIAYNTFDHVKEIYYENGYNCAAEEYSTDLSEMQIELDEQYENGYYDGVQSIKNKSEYQIGSSVVAILVFVVLISIIYGIWKFINIFRHLKKR